jgi:hypothetical protein
VFARLRVAPVPQLPWRLGPPPPIASATASLVLLGIQTGLRVSELVDQNCTAITFGCSADVCCEGKGRKQRADAVALRISIHTVAALNCRSLLGRMNPPARPAPHLPWHCCEPASTRRSALWLGDAGIRSTVWGSKTRSGGLNWGLRLKRSSDQRLFLNPFKIIDQCA